LIPLTIGARGHLSKAEAKLGAKLWREAIALYPRAAFMISLLGYSDDPREIFEFHDARRYVRWWARYAGMDDPVTADRWLGPSSAIGQMLPPPWGTAGVGFLAGCGCFGEEARQFVLHNLKPTVAQ
jgi:hypothetical protein